MKIPQPRPQGRFPWLWRWPHPSRGNLPFSDQINFFLVPLYTLILSFFSKAQKLVCYILSL